MVTANIGSRSETASFAVQILNGQWFTVYASSLILSAAGATYMFGFYSKEIKVSLGYDRNTITLISFFKDVGSNVGVLSGLIAEVTPPWFVLSVGSVLNFFGYFMVWLGVTKRIAKPTVWQMCLYICIGANSQSFADTVALVTCVKHFPESRGAVLGLLKGFVGLSGTIITQIFHAIYGDDKQSFILLIAWLPSVISIIFVRTIRIMKTVRRENELKVFYDLLYISLGLAGFLMTIIIVQNMVHFPRVEYVGSAGVVVFLLFLPIVVVIREEYNSRKNNFVSLMDPSPVEVATENPIPPSTSSTTTIHPPPLLPPPKQENEISWLRNVFRPPKRGDDYTILQAIFSIDMCALLLATICGVGGTLTAMDNLGQIGESQGYPTRSVNILVSLVSIWNYLGRVVAGFGSEYLLKKYKFPRPLVLTLIILLSSVGHILIAFGVPNSFYFVSVIIGFCFGAQWPLLYAIISEIFGLKYYSTLYNFGSVASPIGSYLLNVKVAGNLYDKEADKQMRVLGIVGKTLEDRNCVGTDCFKLAFLIITEVSIFGAFVSGYLVFRTRKFYASDIYKKFREQVARTEMEMAVVGGGGSGGERET